MSTLRFTPEFQEEAVKQAVECGYSAPDAADRLGVSAHSLYKWVRGCMVISQVGLVAPWILRVTASVVGSRRPHGVIHGIASSLLVPSPCLPFPSSR